MTIKRALDSQPQVIKVYQLLAQGQWFSPGTPASSTTKTCRHDIAEILLKLALSTKIQIQTQIYLTFLKAMHNTVKMRIVSTKFIITITGSKCAYIYFFQSKIN